MAELNVKRKSVKEQIESFFDIGKLELALVKDPGCLIEDNSDLRAHRSVTTNNKKGYFQIHSHTPDEDGRIFSYYHIPSVPDLIEDFIDLIEDKNKKFVIVATNIENKVMGYFMYSPKFKKNLDSKYAMMGHILSTCSRYSAVPYEKFYKKELKRLGINYNSRTLAMPGYFWDDKKKIFREKK